MTLLQRLDEAKLAPECMPTEVLRQLLEDAAKEIRKYQNAAERLMR